MRTTFGTTFKIGLALFLSVLVSGAPLSTAYAVTETSTTETAGVESTAPAAESTDLKTDEAPTTETLPTETLNKEVTEQSRFAPQTLSNDYNPCDDTTETYSQTYTSNANENCGVKPCVITTGPELITKDTQFADYQDTRANGHYVFTEEGLRVYTDDTSSLSKVAWYNSVTPYSLADVGEPNIDFELTTGTVKPGMQIALDKDGNGTFDGYVVGEPDYYGDNWWSNADFGVGAGMGYNSFGTLDDYLAANPGAKVIAVGFSLGSGVKADGVLKSLTFGCHQWVFKKEVVPVTTCPAVLNTNHSTNLNTNGWILPTDAEYVNGGIKLNVSGEWDETYIERNFAGPLADIGSNVDFTANPNQYAGIHIVTSKGTLVYEKEPTYDGKWWSTSDFGVASGMGYATFDTLENIVAANPDVTTSLLRVLYTSPAESSSTISSVTAGCTVYTFDKVDATAPGGNTNPGQVLGDSTTTAAPGKTLSASTASTTSTAVLPATLPATGNAANPFMIMIAGLIAYGAAYFLQGRRKLDKIKA